MYSTINNPRSIITFVGRVLDPNKGLITFFDAIELLLILPLRPQFSVWIIGGDDDELVTVYSLLAARPRLKKEFLAGHIQIWGKIEHKCLPEFYRRSLVVVMPSNREPFGLVAIEAMACGTPVVGSKQGGLSDTILNGFTGITTDVDQPDAIAGALLLYLRGIYLRNVHGKLAHKWATSAFNKAIAYDKVADLYTTKSLPKLSNIEWNLRDEFHKKEIESHVQRIENLLGEKIAKWELIAANNHLLAKIETKESLFAVKLFRNRQSISSAILPIGAIFSDRTAGDLIDNAIFHSNNPSVPSLIKSDKESGIAIYSWLSIKSFDLTPIALNLAKTQFSAYGGQYEFESDKTKYYFDALHCFLADRNEKNLMNLDYAAAKLNKDSQNINYGIRLSHPVAELTRIRLCLHGVGWPLPNDITDRIEMVINFMLNKEVDPFLKIQLHHGDLKEDHIVSTESGSIAILDVEHSVFAIGELDLATYAANRIAHGANTFNTIKELYKIIPNRGLAINAIQWLTYFLIFRYLSRIHHGDILRSTKAIRRVLSDLVLI